MTTNDVAAAVEAWIVEILPELGGSTYDYAASRKSKPFPDCAIEVDEVRTGDTPADVGMPDIVAAQNGWEQVVYRSWLTRIMLMTDEDPPAEAQATLQRFSDAVQDGVLDDRGLGGRVQWVSRSISSSFTPPFVVFEDETRGRVVTIEVLIGAAISYAD